MSAFTLSDGAVSSSVTINPRQYMPSLYYPTVLEPERTPMNKEVEAKANALVKEEAAAALRDYPTINRYANCDGGTVRYALCPKCANEIPYATLVKETEAVPEHLRWTCGCGYVMLTKTKDAEVTDNA